MVEAGDRSLHLGEVLRRPFRDLNFTRLIVFVAACTRFTDCLPCVLSAVREEGEIERHEVVRHLLERSRSTLQNFSTVTGLRALTELPAGLVREERVRRRWNRIDARRSRQSG